MLRRRRATESAVELEGIYPNPGAAEMKLNKCQAWPMHPLFELGFCTLAQ